MLEAVSENAAFNSQFILTSATKTLGVKVSATGNLVIAGVFQNQDLTGFQFGSSFLCGFTDAVISEVNRIGNEAFQIFGNRRE